MSVTVKSNKTGKTVTLLNPHEKGVKFSKELKDGFKYTNTDNLKVDNFGDPVLLTDTEASYRAGYLAAQKENAKIYIKEHPGHRAKTEAGKRAAAKRKELKKK